MPAAAVFVGAVADMAGLGRETLTPESFITMAGRFVQIRIRERRGLDFSARRARKQKKTTQDCFVVGQKIGRLRSSI